MVSIVEGLLIGSARIDRWRKEVNDVVKMVLGTFSPGDKGHPGFSTDPALRRMVIHETPTWRWVLRVEGEHQLEVQVYRLVEVCRRELVKEEYCCTLPGSIPFADAEAVREELAGFLIGMESNFSYLHRRLQPFFTAAGDGHIIYEIRLPASAGEARFQKKSGLSFPLPVGTKGFFDFEAVLDGEEIKTVGERYEVVGHYHGFTDSFGVLYEGNTVMQLKLLDAKHPDTFMRILDANGWSRAS